VAENESNSQVLPVELPRGKYAGRLDDKGRLKLPVDFVQFFKALPETKMFLTSLDRHIATLYPIAEWRANEKFFYDFRSNPAAAKRTLFTAQDLGGDVEMDAQGRITVHPELRRELGMEGQELHLMAERGHVQILTDSTYRDKKRDAMAQPEKDLEILEMAGLR
jgi:DNA-binding transcriptional regulator/RsmH inhibitor MraZ